ncbi:guanylate kinase-like protein [Drosophila innubila nudivirus]|uniref:Guanylate kinase-like protein n=1 Tax=Drosophila innubila nudivirus TaxID=2057187 RepID=A0A2H4UX43_9VIRU|nr:guanylate kinase-like protein [Drosophila innubila nudivirus]ATZ81483.1 guanylate kinase-like protein [Drosophila innubila nudivirus]
MTWFERLAVLNLPTTHSNINTLPVYFSGSKYIKQPILDELSQEYTWADVSQISFKKLKSQTKTRKEILKYMLENRIYSKIYKYSRIDIQLLQIIQKYLRLLRKNDKTTLDKPLLEEIYTKCFEFLQEYSNESIIVLIDCRTSYFQKYKYNFNEIILHTLAMSALMAKRILYSFMEFIVIVDEDMIVGEEFKTNTSINVSEINNPSDDIITENYANVESLTQNESENVLFVQQKIYENLRSNDKILRCLDKTLIKKIIINAHKSNTFLDFELN